MGIVSAWYRKRAWPVLLWPLSLLYRVLVKRRRHRLQRRCVPNPSLPPVVVIGNITVGGTGKTPLLIQLARELQARDVRVGIVSRGYGGNPPVLPCEMTALSSVEEVGDEAVLIRRSVDCPFVVDPQRPRGVEALARLGCELVLSDDGLQHYAMARARELVVLDGTRLFGNGLCLPAGPLREPVSRLAEVDRVLVNGGEAEQWRGVFADMTLRTPALAMSVRPGRWVNIATGERVALDALPLGENGRLHAIAGIGNPARFFATVRELGYSPLCHPFPDHYRFSAHELSFAGEDTLVMTQKDAVKCERFAGRHTWYLEIEAQLEEHFWEELCDDMQRLAVTYAAGAEHKRN